MKGTTIKSRNTNLFNKFTVMLKIEKYKYKCKRIKERVKESKVVGVFGSYTLNIKFDKNLNSYIAYTYNKEGINISRRGWNEMSATNELISALL